MTAPKLQSARSVKSRIETLAALAGLLERVERQPTTIGADQYQALVRQLQLALAEDLPAEVLQVLLDAHPGAAEVYENLHYAQAGLSRSSLEHSIGTELLAGQVLARAARKN